MAKKVTGWKPKGMNRDLSVSAYNSEFVFENLNLRLMTNESNTMMSWVNEKGTSEISVTINTAPWSDTAQTSQQIEGIPIGTAVINHRLVLFTTECTSESPVYNSNIDRIYVFEYSDLDKTAFSGKLLYSGHLGFSTAHPIETLISYEADYIQKVYWVDGYNQPRIINIEADIEKIKRWNHVDSSDDPSTLPDTFFDFLPAIEVNEEVSITKHSSGGGLFAPGVIQYCFTYINKYEQQTNMVYVSPLYYLDYYDRGARDDDKVSCSFDIEIENADPHFDYVRLYAIQRSSIDSEPFVRLLEDLPINTGSTIRYTDYGTTGSSMDPTELLFVGGREISALTMTEKDRTLFLGNVTQKNSLITPIQEYFDGKRDPSAPMVAFRNDGILEDEDGNTVSSTYKQLVFDKTSGFYGNTHQLGHNQREITTFKGGERYRFGLQFQKNTGEWSEPVFIEDCTNELYPDVKVAQDKVNLAFAEATINVEEMATGVNACLDLDVYKRVRPVIVYPSIIDRNILCQGVLNPTVFNVEDRKNNSPFAQASWYFRPFMEDTTPIGYEKDHIVNPDSEVIYRDLEAGDTFECDSYFRTPVRLYDEVYVLVASVQKRKALTVLQQGFLVYSELKNYTLTPGKCLFDRGVICLDDPEDVEEAADNDYINYVFISSNEWAVPYRNEVQPGVADEYLEYDASSVTNVMVDVDDSDHQCSYQLAKAAFCSVNNFTVYVQPEEYSDDSRYESFTFRFRVGGGDTGSKYGEVSLASSQDDSSGNYSYDPFNTEGNIAAFMHYESLPTQDDAVSAYGEGEALKKALKKVEIQGSIKLYDTAFSTEERKVNGRKIGTNSQFFVDQSIVTLNSPDIDFDTEVQTYGTDGLKLRIVGAIPITASVSSHDIVHSSNLLETWHNSTKEDWGTTVHSKIAEIKEGMTFGSGSLDYRVLHKNEDANASRRLIAEFLWNDVVVRSKKDKSKEKYPDSIATENYTLNYLVYPWHRSGPLNNDFRTADVASSMLGTKREATLMYSLNTEYFNSNISNIDYGKISSQIVLTENAELFNYRLKRQREKATYYDINYYPNIDKALFNSKGYNPVAGSGAVLEVEERISNTPVSMKYKSTSHAVIALQEVNSNDANSPGIPLLPYVHYTDDGVEHFIGNFTNPASGNNTAFWGSENMKFAQHTHIDVDSLYSKNFGLLWLGELYKDSVDNAHKFGGTSIEALRNNKWLIAGDAVNLPTVSSLETKPTVIVRWTTGDTYYQRYDCLKTYAYTEQDTNQIVDILSFMCETHVNIDGRYDRNRGQIDNINMNPKRNFNLLNGVYSQKDNFFIGRKTDNDKRDKLTYPNYITFSKTKTSGADVDLYTNVTLANTLELDGDKGAVTSLKRLNDQIIAFQDSGISQLLYNENVQISAGNGVPIEIANSGKVQGERYLSDTIGCSNKWSVVSTPSGIYFMDSNDKSIFLFNGQLANVSRTLGFSTWASKIPAATVPWQPDTFENFVSYYDKLNQDVLFINSDTALAYSEKLNAFTSFYSYGHSPYFVNMDDTGIWIHKADGDSKYKLWKHRGGDYGKFFNTNQPYSMTMIGNPEPQSDKIFTNLEFRASMEEEGAGTGNAYTPYIPFDRLEAWNEHQHGITQMSYSDNQQVASKHHLADGTSTLKRKFRAWACDIPRDNAPLNPSKEAEAGIYRKAVRPLNRMRNPWVYLKLMKSAAPLNDVLSKMELHDIIMTYYS